MLQPLNLTVNRSYKVKFCQKWENWMLNGLKSYSKTNRIRKASCEEVCNWVLKSQTEITSKDIQNGFKAAELYSYEKINSEDDDDITIIDDKQSDNNDEESNQFMEKFRLYSKILILNLMMSLMVLINICIIVKRHFHFQSFSIFFHVQAAGVYRPHLIISQKSTFFSWITSGLIIRKYGNLLSKIIVNKFITFAYFSSFQMSSRYDLRILYSSEINSGHF